MEEVISGQLRVVKFIFSWIFPWPFIMGGALILFFGVKGMLRAADSAHWPSTKATVTSSSVKSFSSGAARGRTQNQGEIQYEFFVQQKRYNGRHTKESPDAGVAMNLVERYQKGKEITVYYRPDDPEESLLEPGLKARDWFMPVGGLIFLIPGILMVVYLPKLLKKMGQTTDKSSRAN